jgi:sec-independent protein translocase protein TatA
MGDFAKGIKSFKKDLSDEDTPPKPVEHRDDTPVNKDPASHL